MDIQHDTIFVTLAGSHAHGTAGADSDVDLRGVCIAPLSARLSLRGPFEQWEGQLVGPLWDAILPRLRAHATAHESIETKTESVLFDLAKLVRLAANANPNALEVLFADESDWMYVTPKWHALHTQRRRFLSKKVQETYLGYGLAQLKRIRTHRAWLLDPPKQRPERADFGLAERTTLDRDARDRIEHAIDARMREYALDDLEMPPATRSALRRALERFWLDHLAVSERELESARHSTAAHGLGLSAGVVDMLDAEKRYRNAVRHFQAYEEWKKQRNPRRAELEAKHGYDTKHAMHLVRLMRTGLELLETGELRVRRLDADELVAIRNGKLGYEELVAEAERLAERMRAAAERSTLPADVDYAGLDAVLYDMLT